MIKKPQELPEVQVHFVVFYDTQTKKWGIEPDYLGEWFPNGEILIMSNNDASSQWDTADSDDHPTMSEFVDNLRADLYKQMNSEVINNG
jgi:hypothetical protein